MKNKISLAMRQPYKGLFGSKTDFKVKFIYNFVLILSSRVVKKRSKKKGRVNQRQLSSVGCHGNYYVISGFFTKLLFIGLYHMTGSH